MAVSDDHAEGCAFCSIARGEDPTVNVVSFGKDWAAFFPLHPATPGHTLVIPRQHVADLWQIGQPLAGRLMTAVIRVGRAIDRALGPEGMNLITSAGEIAEQTVFHLHLHVVPRWSRDGFGRIWPLDQTYTDSSMGDVADRIRVAYAQEEL